jgi:hypothetical protein
VSAPTEQMARRSSRKAVSCNNAVVRGLSRHSN